MPKMGSRGYANYRIGVGYFQSIRTCSTTGLPEEEDGCVVATIICRRMGLVILIVAECDIFISVIRAIIMQRLTNP